MIDEILVGERLENGEYQRIALQKGPPGEWRGHSGVLNMDVCIRADGALGFFDHRSEDWLMDAFEIAEGRLAAEERNRVLQEQVRALEDTWGDVMLDNPIVRHRRSYDTKA